MGVLCLIEQDLLQLWNDLHEIPEVSWQEKKTTAYLIDYFKRAGFEPHPFESMPGFYVDIGSGRPIVGLRADIDAVLQEIDGKLQANHSCGHDAHMAIVTGTMFALKEKADRLRGTVRAIFQPAEELGNGAVKVVETGIVDDLDYLFGVHVRPKTEIQFPACAAGIQHGACAFVKGKIVGADHHGARPHEGVNAIEVGSAIIEHLQHIHTSPFVPASIKMTKFHAGTDSLNVIPGEASFGVDIRAQTNDVLKELKLKLEKILTSVMELYHIRIEYEFFDEVPAAVISKEAEQILYDAISVCLGKEHAQKRIVTSGSDDFHFYTLLRSNIKATMLALGADVQPGLHAPNMTFNKEALMNGVKILRTACETLLQGGDADEKN